MLPIHDEATTDELILSALNNFANEKVYYEVLSKLHNRATTEVFTKASALCDLTDARKREIGVQILCLLGGSTPKFVVESSKILLSMLSTESEASVLSALGWGMGHLGVQGDVIQLVKLKDHSSAEVRLGVVGGLLRNPEELAIRTLIELSNDRDSEIRNWATFGLGTEIDIDTFQIREALNKRLLDEHPEVRSEALYGLAARKDSRAIEPLIKRLSTMDVIFEDLLAAQLLGAPELLPALLNLSGHIEDDQEDLEEAISCCGSN